jgi:signal transduction histidine kinase
MQEAVALRDRFLAVASHELRTPLSVVRGHWELLARRLARRPGRTAEQAESSLRRLGQGVDQLRRLVDDLLDVERLGGGGIELERKPVDIVALVQEAVDDLPAQSLPERVRTDLPRGPIIGMWDPARLRQVIDNLLGNAVKYSPRDGRIEASVRATSGGVRLMVRDAGIGLQADQLESVFEPFSRAPNASARHYPGLGLGLAISREIVTQMGGRIWAESEGEGRGTTFFVELNRDESGVPSALEETRDGETP